LLRN